MFLRGRGGQAPDPAAARAERLMGAAAQRSGDDRPLVVLVAGEASGDVLAADLIEALAHEHPHLRFAGVAGPLMRRAGCEGWWDADELAVMGLAEVLRHLPRLLRLRRQLLARILAERPVLLVGVDAPDFNLGLEAKVRAAGIPAAHFVSPTVWAWREGRIRTIRKAVDMMLCMFPFEKAFYDRHGVAAEFVGHPLAAQIPEVTDRAAAREALGLRADAPVLAVLPGSRAGEIQRLAAPYAGTVAWLRERIDGLQTVLPLARPSLGPAVHAALAAAGVAEHVMVTDAGARTALIAADAALVTSGTATLETALLRRPMVAAYRAAPLSLLLLRALRLIRVRNFAMPNLLASRPVVPEFLQGDVAPEPLGRALLPLFHDTPERAGQLGEFANIHRLLRSDPSATAVRALSPFIPPAPPA